MYDDLLRSVLSSITNVSMKKESVWFQATLPVAMGGLGIRRAVQLAPSAFLASAAGCSDLIHRLLPPSCPPQNTDLLFSKALSVWCLGHDESPPTGLDRHKQKQWDTPKALGIYGSVLNTATVPSDRARLLAVANKESGAWLSALPLSTLGLRMDNDVVRIAVGLHLGAPLSELHSCKLCGADVNSTAVHGLSCKYSKGRHPQHSAINVIIQKALSSINVPSILEPSGLYRSDGKRPDGASIIPGNLVRPLFGTLLARTLWHSLTSPYPPWTLEQLLTRLNGGSCRSTLIWIPPITLCP